MALALIVLPSPALDNSAGEAAADDNEAFRVDAAAAAAYQQPGAPAAAAQYDQQQQAQYEQWAAYYQQVRLQFVIMSRWQTVGLEASWPAASCRRLLLWFRDSAAVQYWLCSPARLSTDQPPDCPAAWRARVQPAPAAGSGSSGSSSGGPSRSHAAGVWAEQASLRLGRRAAVPLLLSSGSSTIRAAHTAVAPAISRPLPRQRPLLSGSHLIFI